MGILNQVKDVINKGQKTLTGMTDNRIVKEIKDAMNKGQDLLPDLNQIKDTLNLSEKPNESITIGETTIINMKKGIYISQSDKTAYYLKSQIINIKISDDKLYINEFGPLFTINKEIFEKLIEFIDS